MVVDKSTSTPIPAGPVHSSGRAKYRIRFRKADNLRLVSHHDLMHVFERMLRRAELPLCTTQGFHPQPRMIFAQSLALGIAGHKEVIELELKEVFPPEEVHARLTRQAPAGITILSTRPIDFKASARVRRAFYRLEVPASMNAGLADRCAGLLSATEVWVERTRPRPRRFNLRPYLNKLTCAPLAEPPGSPWALEMAVWVTPYGTIRPEEVAQLLGLGPLLEETFFERTFLELHDEVAENDVEVMPVSLLETPPGSRAPFTTNISAAEVLETAAVPVPATAPCRGEEQGDGHPLPLSLWERGRGEGFDQGPFEDESFNAKKGLE